MVYINISSIMYNISASVEATGVHTMNLLELIIRGKEKCFFSILGLPVLFSFISHCGCSWLLSCLSSRITFFRIFTRTVVLSVLLVLRVEVMYSICHDVSWVDGFFQRVGDTLHRQRPTKSFSSASKF